MANISVQPPSFDFAQAAMQAIIAPFAAFSQMLMRISNANSRIRIIEYMNNLTNQELADRYGIKRNQIVSYVFREMMYL